MAILEAAGSQGPLARWAETAALVRLLEINRAGTLTPILEKVAGHRLVEYPEVDLHALPFPDASWDMVVHSDTLEHVADPLLALRECKRVLRSGGALCMTIPIIRGRLTRRRDGLEPSFHGLQSTRDYLVVSEFGSNAWELILDAGFASLRLIPYEWPDAVAFVAIA